MQGEPRRSPASAWQICPLDLPEHVILYSWSVIVGACLFETKQEMMPGTFADHPSNLGSPKWKRHSGFVCYIPLRVNRVATQTHSAHRHVRHERFLLVLIRHACWLDWRGFLVYNGQWWHACHCSLAWRLILSAAHDLKTFIWCHKLQ